MVYNGTTRRDWIYFFGFFTRIMIDDVEWKGTLSQIIDSSVFTGFHDAVSGFYYHSLWKTGEMSYVQQVYLFELDIFDIQSI